MAVILRANDMHNCLLVSDAYHMFRAKQMMAAEGITVYISPRPSSIPRTVVGPIPRRAARERQLLAV